MKTKKRVLPALVVVEDAALAGQISQLLQRHHRTQAVQLAEPPRSDGADPAVVALQRVGIQLRDDDRLLLALLRAALVFDGHVHNSGRLEQMVCGPVQHEHSSGIVRFRHKSSVIDGVRDKAADIGVHAP